jgi:hypothetical protein
MNACSPRNGTEKVIMAEDLFFREVQLEVVVPQKYSENQFRVRFQSEENQRPCFKALPV